MLPEANSAGPEPRVGDIETFLRETLEGLGATLPRAPRRGPGAPTVLPSLMLWAGILVGVLRGFPSQASIWRLLVDQGLWSFPPVAVTVQAFYQRLARHGSRSLEQLFAQITAVLRERLAPYSALTLAAFATPVVALDETTLDQVARRLPPLRPLPPNDPRLLPGKLTGLFDLRRQQWIHLQYQPDATQNEKRAARAMVAQLPPGSLILADLGYFGFAWFDDLTAAGQWWISRLRAKTSYVVQHVYYQHGLILDAVVWLGAHRADRARQAVRLVRFPVGSTVYTYITNVLEPTRVSLGDLARLYARRWDIELAVKLVKRHLHLHLLWSAKPEVLLQQVWAVLTVAQILHALRFEIAARAGVDPFDVSLPLLVEYAPRYAAQGLDPVAHFVERGRTLHFIRPSRRLQIRAPVIPPEALVPLPPGVALTRPSRYAGRRC